MSPGLAAFTRYMAVNVNVPPMEQAPVIPRPKGGVLEAGSITSSATYQTVAEATITKDKQFHLSKIVVSCEDAAWIIIRWAGTQIGCARLLDDKTVLIEHFPWDYYKMLGDGAKKVEIQAKQYDTAGTVEAELVGEEVTP